MAGGLSEGTSGTIAASRRHIIARYLRSLPSLHRLRRRHVLVADEVGGGMVPRVQPASQDNIAVGDADATIGVIGGRLESGWRVAAKDARHTQRSLASTPDAHRIGWSLTFWLPKSVVGTCCVLSEGRGGLWQRLIALLVYRDWLEGIQACVGGHGEISLALVPPLAVVDHFAPGKQLRSA